VAIGTQVSGNGVNPGLALFFVANRHDCFTEAIKTVVLFKYQ
jgi:hypothetical protein